MIGHQRCREQVLAFEHPSWEGVFSPIDFGHLRGHPIDLRAAITDMVTYNGGPLRCLA